jgi:type I restriction enzyme S subunit
MFGDPVTNPKGWEVVELGSVTESKLGKMLSKASKQGVNPIPYLGNSHVRWRAFLLEELPTMDFTEAELRKLDLRNGDLLVCEGGEVGRCAIWRDEPQRISFQKAIHRVRCNTSKVLSEYLQEYFYMMAFSGGLTSSTSLATIAHLTGVRLKKLPLPLPPLNLQKQFQKFYLHYETTVTKYADQSSNNNDLFNSLLQRAFRGEL